MIYLSLEESWRVCLRSLQTFKLLASSGAQEMLIFVRSVQTCVELSSIFISGSDLQAALSQLSLCLSKITEHWAFFLGQTRHSLKHFVLFLIRLWFIKVEIFIILSLAVWSSFLHIPGSWALSRGQELNVICNWAVAGAGAGQGK